MTLGRGSMLLIGTDRIKGPDILVPAYDDRRGVTAAFNLNLLHRINRELDVPYLWTPFGMLSAGTTWRRELKCTLRPVATFAFRSTARAFL
ncbi:L-histidine N(alpha)-methyltransferase [Bradyrhizobium sp. Ec3.3]|uniref:L-histidine N(alpha)-methyltransferase n=1 Tax=Bradyrhizobium sp. Ec3.3 TaxID=189753 RepID=UPI00048315C3